MVKLIQKNVNPKVILSTLYQALKERVMGKLLSFFLLSLVITSVLLWENKALAQESEMCVFIVPNIMLYGIYLIWATVPFVFITFLMIYLFSLKKVGLSVVFNAALLLLIYSLGAWLWPYGRIFSAPEVFFFDFGFLFLIGAICFVWTIYHPEKTKMGRIILSILFSINLTIFLALCLWNCFLFLF